MSTICPGKTYCWPSPNHQGTRVRPSSLVTFTDSDGSSTDIDGYDTDIDNDTDTITDNISDIDLKNSCEHLDPALKRNAGGSPLTPVASRTVDSGNTVSSMPDNAMAENGIPTSYQRTRKKTARTRPATNGIHRKYASAGTTQVFAYSRLGGVRRRPDGRIEYKICWEPTWEPLEHLEGALVLRRAKELTVRLYGSATWTEAMRKSG